jgi:hypothetical protein
MKKYSITLLLIVLSISLLYAQGNQIRIIMIGAHPDDCDQDGGGTAILFSNETVGTIVGFESGASNGKYHPYGI